MDTQPKRIRKWLVLGAATVGAALGGATIAGAATGSSSSTASTATTATSGTSGTSAAPSGAPNPATVTHGPGETLLTGTTADKVKAAALAAVPGATIIRLGTTLYGAP